nr:hypothetical protein BDOA9_0202750 [Bradyrhizobium sp. DOA9]
MLTSPVTGTPFCGELTDNAIAISMDGRGAWQDNVFVERLWRSVQYEEFYLRAYENVSEARDSSALQFYNCRPHIRALMAVHRIKPILTSLPLRTAA